MSGAYVTQDLEGLAPMLARLNGLGDARRLGEGLANIGGLIESQTRERFDIRETPDGDPWAPWSKAYGETRKKGQTLLVASGAYRDSYAWDLTGDELRVGSNMVQAALLNFGGTEDMAPGPAAVPARQHLGLSADNIAQIEEAMGDWIEGMAQ
ncbi:phage virion morphogenesis protein [Brevundimonas vitis]|uniref:Phage virion morphogenesis protein n=1 Tax=Brevundimonas vitisensis TaxID=2800818 RepID=A0ABX7BJM1_9CAUL|nr:phage virion morphogenesis protein [Brevundimonas vitisensis]QQQ17750.1 phage virion morphogenesis protein [Brevundimonas vitisensis]